MARYKKGSCAYRGWLSSLREDSLYDVLVEGSANQGSAHRFQVCLYLVLPFLPLPVIHTCSLTDMLITFCVKKLFNRGGLTEYMSYGCCSCDPLYELNTCADIFLRRVIEKENSEFLLE